MLSVKLNKKKQIQAASITDLVVCEGVEPCLAVVRAHAARSHASEGQLFYTDQSIT